MKKKFLLLALLTAATVASGTNLTTNATLETKKANEAETLSDSIDKDAIIDNMRGNLTVTAEITETITYDDEDYDYLNSTSTSSIYRDYGYIVEDDGSLTEAVRYIEDGITYFKGDDNCAYYEILKADNTVTTTEVTSSGMSVAYEKNYRNPWKYIDTDDIDDDLYLDTAKASLILECYFGVSRGIVSAKLNVNSDNQVTSIDYSVADIPSGYTDSDDETAIVLSQMTASVTYTYGDTDLRHLTPSTNANTELVEAVANLGSNYTIAMTSSSLSSGAVAYVTEDYIYLHLDSNQKTAVTGDYLLRNATTNYYQLYYYSGSSWASQGYISKSSAPSIYLPGLFLDTLSTALFEETSTGVYALLPDAVSLGATELVMPLISGFDDLGVAGYVKVEDGYVTALGASFDYYSYVLTFTTSISDYGTTTLPGYINTSKLA